MVYMGFQQRRERHGVCEVYPCFSPPWLLRFKVVQRLFTSHPHSYNNDLQTTLWVTQRYFYSSQTFRRSTPCRGQLLFSLHNNTISLTKALIFETFEKNKNIFVSPIASSVNHCYDFSEWRGSVLVSPWPAWRDGRALSVSRRSRSMAPWYSCVR